MAKKKQADRLGAFPLPEGHYFHPQVVASAAHYGESEADRASIRLLQQLLGTPETGYYDSNTESAVIQWYSDHDRVPSLIIDAQTWQEMSRA